MKHSRSIERAYALAKDHFSRLGIHADAVCTRLKNISLSLHCWQGDDVGGFEQNPLSTGAGIQATGNYPGKARSAGELRSDMLTALHLIAGKHRINLHAIYAETNGKPVERTDLSPEHFKGWMEFALEHEIGLDFNPTFFNHPQAASGFTLSSIDKSTRSYWIDHGIACRTIGAYFGKHLKSPCITNFWIPDGYKDMCIDKTIHRQFLAESLDNIFAKKISPTCNRDALESKLFGIGSESYVTGSHEFYMGYALKHGTMLCLDMGHFHPTESVADKISSLMLFCPGLLLHVSRGIRWDSDHVVVQNDELQNVANELVRGKYLDKTAIALDYFDASINRIAAWVIGARATQQALLRALLQPVDQLKVLEREGNFTERLALLEACTMSPVSAVWDYFCLMNEVPVGMEWMNEVKSYEKKELSKRQIVSHTQKTLPDTSGPELQDLLFISHATGVNPDLVQAGGGNTSIKSEDGKFMYIKASGTPLASMSLEKGWVKVDVHAVNKIFTDRVLAHAKPNKRETHVLQVLGQSVCYPQAARPSVETPLHALLDKVVIHTHPVAANAVTCHSNPVHIINDLQKKIGQKILWVPYIDPGVSLALGLRHHIDQFTQRNKARPQILLLQNHGLFCAAPSVYACVELHTRIIYALTEWFSCNQSGSATNATAPVIKKLKNAFVTLTKGQMVVRQALDKQLKSAATDNLVAIFAKPLTPDHIVYSGPHAVIIGPDNTLSEITGLLADYYTVNKRYPNLFIVKNIGMFICAATKAKADAAESLAVSAFKIVHLSGKMVSFMTKPQTDFILNWEAEHYRARQVC